MPPFSSRVASRRGAVGARVAGRPRYRLFLVHLAAALAALLAVTLMSTPSVPATHARSLACETPGITLPRSVYIEAGVDAAIVESAMAEWNAMRPGTFVQTMDATKAHVRVVPATVTWVEMPCGKTTSVVHAGTNADLSYWMAHEMGHTLGLADHIRETTDPSRYINPETCPLSGYDGVMSYCTPRSRWWGPDDRATMASLFPAKAQIVPPPGSLPNRLILPAMTRN